MGVAKTVKGIKGAQVESAGQTLPIEVLPAPVRGAIETFSKDAGLPSDFAMAAALFCVATLAGGKYAIDTPSGLQKSSLYLAVIGIAGSGKSPAIEILSEAIEKRGLESRKDYLREVAEQQAEIKEAKAANQDYEEKKIVDKGRYLTNDTTPEALMQLLKNYKSFGLISDEMAHMLQNRYNSGGLDTHLIQIYTKNSWDNDRKGEGHEQVPYPVLSIFGGIQPAKMPLFMADGRGENGFCDRFLYFYPKDVVMGYRARVNESKLKAWRTLLERLMDIESNVKDLLNPNTPKVIRYSKEAEALVNKWARSNVDRYNSERSETIKSIYSKLDMNIHRVALVLHVMKYASHEANELIATKDTVNGAIQIIEYCKDAALLAREELSTKDPLADLTSQRAQIYEALPPTFKTGEGLQIAATNEMKDKTFKRWLNDKVMFKKISHGVYEKMY